MNCCNACRGSLYSEIVWVAVWYRNARPYTAAHPLTLTHFIHPVFLPFFLYHHFPCRCSQRSVVHPLQSFSSFELVACAYKWNIHVSQLPFAISLGKAYQRSTRLSHVCGAYIILVTHTFGRNHHAAPQTNCWKRIRSATRRFSFWAFCHIPTAAAAALSRRERSNKSVQRAGWIAKATVDFQNVRTHSHYTHTHHVKMRVWHFAVEYCRISRTWIRTCWIQTRITMPANVPNLVARHRTHRRVNHRFGLSVIVGSRSINPTDIAVRQW